MNNEEVGLSGFPNVAVTYTLRTTIDTFTLQIEPGSFRDETVVLVKGVAMPMWKADIAQLQGKLEEFLKKGRG